MQEVIKRNELVYTAEVPIAQTSGVEGLRKLDDVRQEKFRD